jgi:ArsR family transcriptional regulator
MEKYLEHTKVFKALGDPKRAMIVDMLSCGELCACMILEKFERKLHLQGKYRLL